MELLVTLRQGLGKGKEFKDAKVELVCLTSPSRLNLYQRGALRN